MSVLSRILPKLATNTQFINNVYLKDTHFGNFSRNLSVLARGDKSKNGGLFPQSQIEEFTSNFPTIIKNLSETRPEYSLGESFSINKYVSEIFDHNLLNTDKKLGLMTVAAYKNFEKPENLTWDNIRKANIMGWCVEILKTFYTIMEDVIDDSDGLSCWHKRENVGLNAINDGLFIFYSIYTLFGKNFKNLDFYMPAISAIEDVSQSLFIGKNFEDLLIKKGKPQLNLYTTGNFYLLSKYKNYLHLPIVLALYMAKFGDEELHSKVRNVAVEIGHLYQIQRDFSNFEKNGDIFKGKCTWMAVKALEKANSTQRDIMEEYYGRPGSRAAKIIQNLYLELSLPKIYDHDTQRNWKNIQKNIAEVPEHCVKEILVKLLNNIHTKKD